MHNTSQCVLERVELKRKKQLYALVYIGLNAEHILAYTF